MTGTAVASIVVGLCLLVVGGICWSGAWRSWTTTFLGDAMITLVPMLGLAFVVGGIGRIVSGLYLACGALMLVLVIAGIVLAIHRPSWWAPAWYRAGGGRERTPVGQQDDLGPWR